MAVIRAAAVITVAGVVVAACGGDAPTPGQVSEVPLWAAGQEWALGGRLLEIGGPGAGTEGVLHGVRAAVRGASGSIFVADASGMVRVFDSAGAPLLTFGGLGGGPAEFDRIDALAFGPGDTLWVGDGSRRRVVAFSRNGRYLAGQPLDRAPSHYGSRIIGFTASGDPIVQGLRLVRPTAPDAEGPLSPNYLEWYRYDRRSGRAVDLATAPWREEWAFRWQGRPQEGEVIFGARSHGAVVSDGLVVAGAGNAFQLVRWDASGDVVRSFGRRFEPVEPTDEDRAAFVQEKLWPAGSDAEARRWRTFYDALPMRETFAPVEDVVSDRTDGIWVRLGGPPGADSSAWSVFDARGRWLGDVALPGVLRPLEIGDDYVLGVSRDELDVESVVLFRLVKERS